MAIPCSICDEPVLRAPLVNEPKPRAREKIHLNIAKTKPFCKLPVEVWPIPQK
ncbi:MAG: hypothetical protein OEZ22_12175 [Spirochaetia bacterium]|nr:hypothetical protein [Spirochaetia bacterium]